MKRFTLILSLLVAMVTTAMAQKITDFDSATTDFATYQGPIANIVDGDHETFWWSEGGQDVDKTVSVILNKAYYVGTVKWYFNSSDKPHGATIESRATADGDWVKVAEFTDADIDENNVFECDAHGNLVKELRLRITTAHSNWLQVAEVELFEPVLLVSNEPEMPEFVYTMTNGNGLKVGADAYWTEGDGGKFAFYAVEGKDDTYYIYSVTEGKWLGYEMANGYSNGKNFVTLDEEKGDNYFKITKCANNAGSFEMRPYKNNGTEVAALFINYHGGKDEKSTLGLWEQSGDADGGSRYSFSELRNNERATYKSAYTRATEVLNGVVGVVETEMQLQTTNPNDPYYLMCNHPETAEGDIANLVDNSTSTGFFHSQWKEPVPAAPHYLMIDLGEENKVKEFTFGYHTRFNVVNDFPDGIKVLGSNDGVDFTQVYNVTSGLPQSSNRSWKSDVIVTDEAYRYYRFDITAERTYWHMSEFDFYEITRNINEEYQSGEEQYNNLFALYSQHLNSNEYTTGQYMAATEALNTAIADMLAVFADEKAQSEGIFDAYAGKVGYPKQAVIDAYNTALENAINRSAVEAAKNAVYSSTDINMPAPAKAYTLTMVAKNGKKYYLNYTGSDIAMVERAENAELPLTALYTAEAYDENGEAGVISLKTIDGKYLVFHSAYNGVNWLQDGGNKTGLQAAKDDMTKLTFTKIENGGNVAADNNSDLFGLFKWYSKRGFDTGKNQDSYGYMVLKTDASNYDGAGAPFWNNDYSSAFALEEYSGVPAPGKFYTVRSANTARDYVNTTALIYTDANNGLVWHNGYSNENSNAVWTFEADGTNNYAKNVHTNMYLNGLAMSETPANVVPTLLGDGQFAIRANGNMLHAQSDNKAVANWDCTSEGQQNKSNASAWYIDEVESFSYTLAVGEAGWSTLVLGYNATIPTDADFEAYTVKSINNGYVYLGEEPVTGVLAANTPVIVKAPQGRYKFVYTTDEATVTESLLSGTLYNKNIQPDGVAYVLSKQNDVVALYKAALNKEDNTAFLNNANKAYLVVPGASEVASYSFRFGEGTTGIDEITDNRVQSTVIFDLTGRRVENISAPGIYIVNGKKVLVK